MYLEDGYHTCKKCNGEGCYWCRRTGKVAQCPVCLNREPELIAREDNELTCYSCNSKFKKNGEII